MQRSGILGLVFACALLLPGSTKAADRVSCLGRVEPLDGVILLAGPSRVAGAGAVIAELKVEEGDWVEPGQVLAVLDDHRLRSAELSRQKEMVEDARVRLQRLESLSSNQATSRAKLDEARYELRALEADQRVFEARQELSLIRSPGRAQVLRIRARPGEKVDQDGVFELGRTDQMSVVAEVFETDIGQVKAGQKAIISSPALPAPLSGTVSRIRLSVGRMDVFEIDPIARTDARVVEAIILLDDSEPVSGMTNLQVDVEIAL